ncbi:ASCH domain-containing protein [Paenibacillus chibensis]|uniref:ASCH domain-containing protein n=1 Tax=Paenibacillus chibensis TaxID=59846 RepID=A0ABU6PUZ8_9BACL|nr:ASCH domain-containing protein [Paenibacillus chibensis]
MDALIIKAKWADLILNGSKRWEIRGSRTTKRGTIGIIKSRSGKVYGQVDLVGCIPLTMDEWANNKDKHMVDYADIDYNTPHAWVLANPVIYPEPIAYQHPQGAVIWVKLPESIHSSNVMSRN